MKNLILGGAGFLGTNLVRRLVARGEDVVVLDSLDPRIGSTLDGLRPVLPQIRLVRADLADTTALAAAVREAEVVVHLAAQTSHPLSLREPLFDAETNCLGTLRVLEAVRRERADAIVVTASTSTVVGKATQATIDEEHREDPTEIYSANKGVAEKYHHIYHRVHGLRTAVVRLPNVFGPFGKASSDFGFLNHFLHLARTGGPLTVFGAGDQLRNVLYVEDAIDALLAARRPDLGGRPWLAAHPEHRTVRELADGIVKVFGGRVDTVPWPAERKRIEVDHQRLDGRRFAEATGWRPAFSFEEGLLEMRRTLEAER